VPVAPWQAAQAADLDLPAAASPAAAALNDTISAEAANSAITCFFMMSPVINT